jgi:hypothetical protein
MSPHRIEQAPSRWSNDIPAASVCMLAQEVLHSQVNHEQNESSLNERSDNPKDSGGVPLPRKLLSMWVFLNSLNASLRQKLSLWTKDEQAWDAHDPILGWQSICYIFPLWRHSQPWHRSVVLLNETSISHVHTHAHCNISYIGVRVACIVQSMYSPASLI